MATGLIVIAGITISVLLAGAILGLLYWVWTLISDFGRKTKDKGLWQIRKDLWRLQHERADLNQSANEARMALIRAACEETNSKVSESISRFKNHQK